MATVKIPDAVLQVLVARAADVVSNVVKKVVEDKTKTKKGVRSSSLKTRLIEIPYGAVLRMRIKPR